MQVLLPQLALAMDINSLSAAPIMRCRFSIKHSFSAIKFSYF